MRKKKILIFIDWFLPGYKAGGPITSIANMVNQLKHDFDFYIVTGDRDSGDAKPYDDVVFNQFLTKDSYNIIYLSPNKQRISTYRELIRKENFSVIYFNSLFSFKFTLLPMFVAKRFGKQSKIVLAPRGMLGAGALSLKPFKKALFIRLSRISALYKNIHWHATDKQEQEDIYEKMSKTAKIFLASNLVRIPERVKKPDKSITRFIFMSRISRKKNLHFAIKAFAAAKGDAEFDIYGPIEDLKYWQKCQEDMGNSNNIKYKGMVSKLDVFNVFANYHVFLFPTLHENFGHSIFEALASACPVIISKYTPWNMLENKNAGVIASIDNENDFVLAIQKYIDMPKDEYAKQSDNAYHVANDYFTETGLKQKYQKFFDNE